MITAIIQPDKLDEVRDALLAAEITRITVNRVTGHGREE
ncbi:MAG TPA: P-II family nitrogen regulator, partial [Leptospiraceae bacterium]|nr:P-II family nitrogen regulator [Leptospiraceae bacterium]